MNKEEIPESKVEIVKSEKEEIVHAEIVEDLLTIAEKRTKQVAKAMQASLGITAPQDWVNQDGRPYLTHAGAEKVARLFGVKITNVNTVKIWSEDSNGRYYFYKTTGTVALPGNIDSIEALGTRSQRDKLFGWKDGQWKDDSEIDETNIMKASYSNFVVNGITHLLGLRNLNWQQLQSAGISEQSVVSVQYGGKSAKKPPPTKKTAKKKEKAKVVLSPEAVKKRKEIWDMAMEMKASNEEEAKQLLEVCSAVDKDGKMYKAEKIEELKSEKWINHTYEQMKERYDKEVEGKK